MIEVIFTSGIPNHPIAIITSLTYCSVLSGPVVFEQVVPRYTIESAYGASIVITRIFEMLRDRVPVWKIPLTPFTVRALVNDVSLRQRH